MVHRAKGHRWSAFSRHAGRGMRRAKVAWSVTCCCEATSVTAGERSDTETVTLREARGGWRRAVVRWYLASHLLNLGYPFQNKQRKSCVEHLARAVNKEEKSGVVVIIRAFVWNRSPK